MKRRWLILLVILALLVGGLVFVLFNLNGFVAANKDKIIERAEKQLGRDIAVADIGVNLSRGIGIRLDELKIADDPAFSADAFLTADRLLVNMKLLPLLKKQFVVKRFVIVNPHFNIIRNERGELNIDGLTQASGDESGTSDRAALTVSLLNIRNGTLVYSDLQDGTKTTVSKIESETGLSPDEPNDFRFAAAMQADEQNIELDGTFGPLNDDDPRQTPIQATIRVTALRLKDVYDLAAADAELPEGLVYDGAFSLEGEVSGTLSALDFKLKLDASSTSFQMPDVFQKTVDVPLVLEVAGRKTDDKARLETINLNVDRAEFTGNGDLHLGATQNYDVTLTGNDLPLDALEKLFPAMEPFALRGSGRLSAKVMGAGSGKPDIEATIVTADARFEKEPYPKPFEDMKGTLTLKNETGRIENGSLRVGDSSINFSGDITSIDPFTLDYRANSPRLALVDVRPPNPAAKKPEVLSNVTATGVFVGTEKIRNTGTLNSATGSVANLDYADLKMKFDIDGDMIGLPEITAKTLSGSVRSKGTVDMSTDEPAFSFETTSRDLNLVELFEQLPAFGRQHLRGKANLDFTIDGQGAEWEQTQTTLNGSGLTELFEGELVDLNVFQNVLKELSELTGGADWASQSLRTRYPKLFGDRNTAFRNFASTFVVENGRLKARNLRLTADQYVLTGVGAMDMKGVLDLNVTMTMTKPVSDDLIADHKALKYLANSAGRIQLPLRISGRLPKAKFKPEDSILRDAIRRALIDKGKGALGEGLRDLFGRSKGKGSAPPDTTKSP